MIKNEPFKLIVAVNKGDDGSFTASIHSDNAPFSVVGTGDTYSKACDDFWRGLDAMRASYKEKCEYYPDASFRFARIWSEEETIKKLISGDFFHLEIGRASCRERVLRLV